VEIQKELALLYSFFCPTVVFSSSLGRPVQILPMKTPFYCLSPGSLFSLLLVHVPGRSRQSQFFDYLKTPIRQGIPVKGETTVKNFFFALPRVLC